jgi:hypothetical protein
MLLSLRRLGLSVCTAAGLLGALRVRQSPSSRTAQEAEQTAF